MEKATLKINGMTCEHCAGTVQEALMKTDGVSKVKVTLRKGEAKVYFDDSIVSVQQLGQIVADAGYEFL